MVKWWKSDCCHGEAETKEEAITELFSYLSWTREEGFEEYSGDDTKLYFWPSEQASINDDGAYTPHIEEE